MHDEREKPRTSELTESERLNLAALDAILSRVAVLDDDGRILATNFAWRRFASEAGDPWHAIADGENCLAVYERATGEGSEKARALAAGIREVMTGRRETFTLEYPAGSPHGRQWFLCRVTRLSSDASTRIVTSHSDATDVHTALEQIAADARVFSSLAQASPVGIFRLNAAGGCEFVNGRCCEITGVSEADARKEGWRRALHPLDRERVVAAWDASVRTRSKFRGEYRFVRDDGTTTWVIGQVVPIEDGRGGIAGYMGTLTEITERKKLELAMTALSTDLIALDGAAYVEMAARRIASLLDADAVIISRLDRTRPDHLHTLAVVRDGALVPNFSFAIAGTPCGGVIDGRRTLIERDLHSLYPDDEHIVTTRMEAFAGETLVDHDGKSIGVIGVLSRRPFQDAETTQTILKLFAGAVAAAMGRERSQRQFEDLFEFSPGGLVTTDERGCIALVNRQSEEIFGWTRAEMIGQPIEMLVPPELREGHVQLHRAFMQSAERRQMAANRPLLRARRKDGTDFPVEIDLAPLQSEHGAAVTASVRDVTARTALEAQVGQAMKLEALGKLTGGMAHDFNNYLNVIIGNLDLLRIQATDPTLTESIDAALDGANRAAELTKGLLAFARRQALDSRLADVNDHVSSVVALLKRTLGEDVTLATTLAPDLWTVKIDGAQFDSSIINLAQNARDAMSRGGTVSISTRNVQVDESYRQTHPDLVVGDYVLIEVADSGSGMPAAVVDRIFEPFFTTKGPGHGTGLGLSMVYGFVKQSGGHVNVYSEVGHGTVVRIYLPRFRPAVERDDMVRDQHETEAVEGRGETILVVEDNEQVRQTTVALLSALGYVVLAAENAAAAMAIIERAEQHIDLMFTDVIMPGNMDGYDLATLAIERRPDLKVVLTSGFSGDLARASRLHLARLKILPKPYRKRDLARAIRDAL